MLFAHITEFPRNDNTMDVSILPKYHVLNDPKLGSRTRLSRMLPVVHRLSERFSGGENCVGPDVKNESLVVEQKSSERYVQLVEKPTDNDVSTPDMSVSGDNVDGSITRRDAKLSCRRELLEKTKSLIRELGQPRASASNETSNAPKEEQFSLVLSASSSSNPSSDVSDTENVAARHRPTVDAMHYCDRRKQTKPSAMEKTWKMLDSALFRNTKSQPEMYSDKSLVKSVHCDRKQFPPVQIPLLLIHLPPELMKTEHCVNDPRLTQSQQRKDRKELDLPLPKFAVSTALAQQADLSAVEGYDTVPHTWRSVDVVTGSGGETEDANDQHRSVLPLPKFGINAALAQQLNGSAVESCETVPHAQRPIDVIIGAGRVTEPVADDQRRDARFQLMQSLERSVRLLDMLTNTETEFSEFSRELIRLQDKVATAISKHYDTN